MNLSRQTSAFLKLLFGLLVFNFHFSAIFNGLSAGQGFGDISFFLNRGDVAVTGFFFLSGYALFRNGNNEARSILSIASRNYYRILMPFFLVATIAFCIFDAGYGDVAVKVSGLGYGWSLIMPFGMLSSLSVSDIPKEFGLLLTENIDRFTLLGWILAPLLIAWTAALLFMKKLEAFVSKDLALVIAMLAVVLEFFFPIYKGLMSCFVLGGVAARLSDIEWSTSIHAYKNKLGVMKVPMLLLVTCASAATAAIVVSDDAVKVYIFGAGFSWYVYFATDMRYLANLPVVLCICVFVCKMDASNLLFKISTILKPYIYPFLLVNYLVFSLLANFLYEMLLTPSLMMLYLVSFVASMIGAFFIDRLIYALQKLLWYRRDFDDLKEVSIGQE